MNKKEQKRELCRRLQEQGLWIPRTEDPRPSEPFNPVQVKGKPISQTLIEDRE